VYSSLVAHSRPSTKPHTRAPKTLNLYTKHMVYDGVTGRNEKDLEMMLATMSRVSKSGIQPQRGFLNYTPSEGR